MAAKQSGANAPLTPPDSSDIGRQRFEIELELVQCLASPEYLHCEGAYRIPYTSSTLHSLARRWQWRRHRRLQSRVYAFHAPAHLTSLR